MAGAQPQVPPGAAKQLRRCALGNSASDPYRPNMPTLTSGLSPAQDEPTHGERSRWVGDAVLSARGRSKVLKVRERDNLAGDQYALKELKHHANTTAVRRFAREVEVTRSLAVSNVGVVPVIDYYVPRHGEVAQPWYVMPLASSSLEGATEYKGDVLAVLRLGIHLARTLAAAHDAAIIHRDLKPANLLKMSDGTVKIADFGIAFIRDEDERLTGDYAHTVGTRPFIAPELILQGPAPAVTPMVDVYSLGKTLYALASGGTVFEREDHRADEYNLAFGTGDDAFEHFHALLDRMVTRDPRERFQDARSVTLAFERAVVAVEMGAVVVPGMYGTGDTPLAMHRALFASLISQAPGRGRARARATDSAVDAAAARIAMTGQPGIPPDQTLDPGDGAAAVAIDCGEFLLAAGAAMLMAEEDELVHEWVSRLKALLEFEHSRATRRDKILHDAAAFALVAAGGIAWKHASLGPLRAVIDGYHANADSISYLPLSGAAAEVSAKWLADGLRGSLVLAEAEPWVCNNAETVVGLVSGLALLRHLGWMPAAERAAVELEASSFDDFHALFDPYWAWMSEIGLRCRENPSFAARLGDILAVTSERDLAKACARLHPLLMRLIQSRYRGRRSIRIGHVDQRGGWSRWLSIG